MSKRKKQREQELIHFLYKWCYLGRWGIKIWRERLRSFWSPLVALKRKKWTCSSSWTEIRTTLSLRILFEKILIWTNLSVMYAILLTLRTFLRRHEVRRRRGWVRCRRRREGRRSRSMKWREWWRIEAWRVYCKGCETTFRFLLWKILKLLKHLSW